MEQRSFLHFAFCILHCALVVLCAAVMHPSDSADGKTASAPFPGGSPDGPSAPNAPLARSAGVIGLATMASRVLGLVREQIMAYHAYYGSLIRRPYGEPYHTRETMVVTDVAAVGVATFG